MSDINEEFLLEEDLRKKKEKARKIANDLRKQGKVPEPIIILNDGQVKKASNLNIKEQSEELVKCARNPIYFIKTYLTIFDQTVGDEGELVPFNLFPFQEDLVKLYQEERFVIANKYRQAGISTTTCAYIAWYIMFKQNRSVAIIANKLETARDELMNDVVDFIESCPIWLKPAPDIKDTQKLKRYDNGCELAAFSSTGLRGYTPTLLFWDETAWTEKSDKFWTSAKPTLQTGGRAIMVSCVVKDSYIFTNKGIKQIKDYIPNENLGGDIINDTYLLGSYKTRKSNIIFKNGYVDTLKIDTTYSSLESSFNHKYWGYLNNKYDWYEASKLKIGDYISIQMGMNIWGNNDDCSNFKPTISNKIKNKFIPKKITEDIAYLIGLYISEGYIRESGRNNTGGDLILTCGDDLTEILNKLKLPFYNDGLHYQISSKNLLEFFKYLGFDITKKAPQKIIPNRLLEMSKKNMISLIQGIMDGDGYASYNDDKNKLRIGIGLSSKELINQIRIIFNNFGILTEYNEVETPITKKVKVKSTQYRIIANNYYALKYFKEIGFRFKRKNDVCELYKPSKLKHTGNFDVIPNGSEILKELYTSVKFYGIHKFLKENKVNVKDIVQRNKGIKPVSRKTILKFIDLFKNKIPPNLLSKYKYILSDNIVWVKIKSIENLKNWTYDFSMSNDNQKEYNEHHMSLIYNGFITHQTPNGLDPVFYKTFEAARQGESTFKAIELWWFNDPRYNEGLEWVKNKGKENEIRIKDEGWSSEHRIKLQEDGWFATSPWLENEIKAANGDMRKIAQEILCIGGDSIITLRNKKTKEIFNIKIKNFYRMLEFDKQNKIISNFIIKK